MAAPATSPSRPVCRVPIPIVSIKYGMIPTAQDAARVGTIPRWKQNIAMPATTAIANAHASVLAKSGRVKSSPKPLIGSPRRNIVRVPNLTAKVRTTPSTPPVMALKVALISLLSRNLSMNGPTRKIHKKLGMEMIHMLSRPPRMPAAIGGNTPGWP